MTEQTNVQKLQALAKAQQNTNQNSNFTQFDNVVVVNICVPERTHFPKMKDAAGNKVKDEQGNDKRSTNSDGFTYTFVEFATAKVVKIVLPKKIDLEILGTYKVSGLGYDIKQSNMLFIEKDTHISKF